jgi:uncharacterized membrane protein
MKNYFEKLSFLALVIIAALILGTFLRFMIFYRHLPLWIDEAWTGAIVSQSTLGATIDQILLDANAPAYFILMHFWTSWFGLSDITLRIPSLVFGLIAPLVALPTKGLEPGTERSARLLWCGLLALSIPGIWYSQEARCYSLAFLLATACTVAYMRLLTHPSTGAAVRWVLLGCLGILTQYHFLIIVGCQGVFYLAVHRQRALHAWPAAIFFLPAVVWMGVHIPHVIQYADPKASPFSIVNFNSLFPILGIVFGNWGLGVLLLIVALLLGILDQRRCLPGGHASSSMWFAAGTAIVSAMLFISMGLLYPVFTIRYLIVFIPGILLGISLLTAHFSRHWKTAPFGIMLIYAINASVWISTENDAVEQKSIWNFERPSDELKKEGVDHVIFVFENTFSKVLQPTQLKELGGFFFKRAGLTIPVTPALLMPGDKPGKRLLMSATTPHSAILWVYELPAGTVSYLGQIEQLDHAWVCNNSGKRPIGVVACHRK